MTNTAGFDIGGSFVKAGVLDPGGQIVVTAEKPTPRDSDPQSLVELVRVLCEGWKIEPPIGLAIAGIVAPARGRLARSPNLPHWDGVEWANAFAGSGLEPEILNDANAFVLAEYALGSVRGVRSVFGLAIGTGVGGGFLMDGELYTGARGYASEPGHMILVADGPKCACGARGCLEALVGSPAISRRYLELQAGAEELTPAEIVVRADRGESSAIEALSRTGHFLGLGLASVANLLDPEVFVIGGGVSAAGEWILQSARRTMEAMVLHPAGEAPRVQGAALGNAAGWIGAALAAARRRETRARG